MLYMFINETFRITFSHLQLSRFVGDEVWAGGTDGFGRGVSLTFAVAHF